MPARKPKRARRRGSSASASARGAPLPGTRRLRNGVTLLINLRTFIGATPENDEARFRRFRRLTEEELKQCKPSEGSFVEFLSRTFPVTERERRYEKLIAEEEAKARTSETRSIKRSAKRPRSKGPPAKKLRSKRSPSKRSTSRD
jgi:hypothetical protein